MDQNAPVTITQSSADRIEDGPNGKLNFKLIESIQTSSGTIPKGKMTTTKKAYSVADWNDAKKNLGWN